MKKRWIHILIISIVLVLMMSTSVFAITDADVQAAVDNGGKEAVSGNIFIWFLCAIAFLKVSQKIDSFMSSLGISVGRTGGSMLTEAMIAARGIGSVFKGAGGFAGFGKGGGSTTAAAGGSGFFGSIGRKVAGGAAGAVNGNGGSGGIMGAVGRKMYDSSLGNGGKFAAGVISSIARGERSQMGTITGDNAKSAMESYFGFHSDKVSTAKGGLENSNTTSFSSDHNVSGTIGTKSNQGSIPQFSDVEMGGGRITGMEITSDFPEGINFAMYDAEKFDKPEGNFEMSTAVDGSKWYKQYAQPSVEKTPYMDTQGKVAYNEKIVSKLPKAPIRKEKI